jgi:hypothetical protein
VAHAALRDALLAFMGPEVAFTITSACTLGGERALHDLLGLAGLADVIVDDVQLDVQLGDLSLFLPRHLGATPAAAAVRMPFRQWVATGHARTGDDPRPPTLVAWPV